MFRTHTCGSLNKDNIGKTVSLAGWVNRRRDHGGLVFIDLRDKEGLVQAVFNPEISAEALKTAEQLRSEHVITLTGDVAQRPAGTENSKIPTGDVEVIVKKVESYLKKGDITGIYKETYSTFLYILRLLNVLKEEISPDKPPELSMMWELNDVCSESSLFGSYVSRVFYAIFQR